MNGFAKRLLQALSVVLLLYLFLVSIKLMGVSFKLFGSGFAEELIRSCSNPFVGLFIGILATSIMQSSSTTTSLIVGFVGGGILPVVYAIPMIMGANIGTTVTNILVSFTFLTRREDFRRAFAGATVHDFFNLLTVALFFPLEMKFHFIQRLAFWMTGVFEGAGGVEFTSPLTVIVKPAVKAVQHFMFDTLGLPVGPGATLLLVIAVIGMIFSLVCLVKLMRRLVIGQAELFMDRYLFRNDVTAFLLGIGLTILVQSSSITTSLAVPLVGAGVLSLARCYPYTLGANIGTTCTALLASLATVTVINGQPNTVGVTAAFAHLMFNICGIAVFYPLKRIPIWLAERMSSVVVRARWMAAVFVLAIFFVLPILAIYITR